MGSAVERKSVCVIGAGASGLIAIKYLRERGFSGTVFEQSDRVGGLWHYVESTEKDVNGLSVHTAMYPGLRTNIAKELTRLDDLEFPDYEDGVSHVSHVTVERYLNDYADKFNLRENIKFNCKVLEVKPITSTTAGDDDEQWAVSAQDLKTSTVQEYRFDAVIVANGMHFEPNYPELAGLEDFGGRVLHTKFYRKPTDFRDQRVVVLGLGPSAIDIAMEICEFAKEVTISHQSLFEIKCHPKNVKIIKSHIAMVKKDSILLENGEEIPCDSLVLGTGYKYSYPFLHPDCGMEVKEGKYVWPLYKHLVSAKYPTLCFLSLFPFAPVWNLAQYQTRYFVSFLEGRVRIPSASERLAILEEEEAERRAQAVPVKKSHIMGIGGKDVWPYLKTLATEGGFSEFSKTLELFKRASYVGLTRLFGSFDSFRNDRVRYIDAHNVRYSCSARKGHEEESPAEVLHLSFDEETGIVSMTSDLGEIHNKPLDPDALAPPLAPEAGKI